MQVVLEAEPPLKDGRIQRFLHVHIAVFVRLERLGVDARGHRQPQHAGDRQGFHQLELVRKIAEALAEEELRCPGVEALGVDLLTPGAAHVPAEAERQQELVRGVLEEHVLRGDFQIVEAAHGRALVGIQHGEASGERDSEIGAEPLRELAAQADLLRRGRLLGAPELEVRDRRQRQLVGHEGIVGGQGRGKEPLADQAVSLGHVHGRERERQREGARE